MGIRVAHQIKGDVLGEAAWASGQAQGMERRREQDRNYSLNEEINAIRERARQDANMRFFYQLQAQKEANDQEMAFRVRQYEEYPERQQLLGQIENDLRKDYTNFEYTRAQQQQLEKLASARDYVQRNPDGRYNPGEQENLLRQIDEMEFGIQPTQRRPEMPWPKEQDVGQVWTDTNTGAMLTRDDKGNVKMLNAPDDSTSFANQLKLKEKIAGYAEDIIRTSQGTDKEVDRDTAIKMAENFFGFSGTGQDSAQPPPAQPQGDEETMADTILQNIMSPETYQAAKATGLPSIDIYYMAQQLTQQAKQTPVAKPVSGDVSKKDWMANDQNFNQYRQRFADSIPQSQIEEVYKNDPYIASNNSALAQADHEVTTPHATWEELTDHQRQTAYQRYLDDNKMSLGDRFGMAVSKVISRSDYENYQQRQKAHQAKLLTEEKFAQRCDEDSEFLWKYMKVPNRPVPAAIDQTQVDMHRAIDMSRRPVFGGL